MRRRLSWSVPDWTQCACHDQIILVNSDVSRGIAGILLLSHNAADHHLYLGDCGVNGRTWHAAMGRGTGLLGHCLS